MSQARDIDLLLDDMLAHAEQLEAMLVGVTKKEFMSNLMLRNAVKYDLAIIGEAANIVPKDFAAKHYDVAFKAAASMRHRLIHGYGTVDEDIVWEAVTENIPSLIMGLRTLIVGLAEPPKT